MASRTNACSELTRFWLQVRHGCFIDESVPVEVRYATSDIDLAGLRPDSKPFLLPNGVLVGPRIIVETKDEHDWEPSGKEFGALLREDVGKMGDMAFVPAETAGIKFTMLRQQHYKKASTLFGTDDFDRLFVVHALDPLVRAELGPQLERLRIHWITIPELLQDLVGWYGTHPRPAILRHSLVGDLLHLLIGFCQLGTQTEPQCLSTGRQKLGVATDTCGQI